MIEVVMYLFLSLLLTGYLFQWLDTIVTNVSRLSCQVHGTSNLIFAHLKFLQIVNNAPCQDSAWLLKEPMRCCWKSSKGTVCLYYKNGSLIQKVSLKDNGTTTRLVLLSSLFRGDFQYCFNNNTIECVEFRCCFNGNDKEFFLCARTRSESS